MGAEKDIHSVEAEKIIESSFVQQLDEKRSTSLSDCFKSNYGSKITFKELQEKWNDLCVRTFTPLRVEDVKELGKSIFKEDKELIKKMNRTWKDTVDKLDSPKHKLFIQQLDKEWGEILNQSGWTRIEEMKAYSEYSIYSRTLYSQLERGVMD